MTFAGLLGTRLALIQAPMAGVQGVELALAVSGAGGLGSLPCAMLGQQALRDALTRIRAQGASVNINFFCHEPPGDDAARSDAPTCGCRPGPRDRCGACCPRRCRPRPPRRP